MKVRKDQKCRTDLNKKKETKKTNHTREKERISFWQVA